MAVLEPGALWFQLTCKPNKSFDGWLGIYETKSQADQAAELAESTSPLVKGIRIKKVECLPPGDYYIGDIEPILRELIDFKIMSHLLESNGKGGVYKLEDGTTFSIFKTFSGDGIWEDQIGNCYAVDSGTIGAFPRKKLGKQAIRYNYKRFKYPAICKVSEEWSGCIEMGSFYIFTDYSTRPTKEDKNAISEHVYKRKRGIDEILATLKVIYQMQISGARPGTKASNKATESTNSNDDNTAPCTSRDKVKEGANIFHESHGEGIIQKVFGQGNSTSVAVNFKDSGLKVLDLRMNKITFI
jgi:hypothetical protein